LRIRITITPPQFWFKYPIFIVLTVSVATPDRQTIHISGSPPNTARPRSRTAANDGCVASRVAVSRVSRNDLVSRPHYPVQAAAVNQPGQPMPKGRQRPPIAAPIGVSGKPTGATSASARRHWPAYQIVFGNKPKCGCCATRITGGPVRLFEAVLLATVLRLGGGFSSAFLGSVVCGSGFGICVVCNCAKVSRMRADVPVPTGALVSANTAAAGVTVGRLVSNSTRAGHF
jgi:hypothetical protein